MSQVFFLLPYTHDTPHLSLHTHTTHRYSFCMSTENESRTKIFRMLSHALSRCVFVSTMQASFEDRAAMLSKFVCVY